VPAGILPINVPEAIWIGKIPAGTDTYLQNAGYVWLILLIPLSFATWMGMNNITEDHVFNKIKGKIIVGIGIIFGGFWTYRTSLFSPCFLEFVFFKECLYIVCSFMLGEKMSSIKYAFAFSVYYNFSEHCIMT
jgi:hypothetical protein